MQINLSKNKIYTILLSLFYVFGLIGVFYSIEIPASILTFGIIVYLIFKYNAGYKKSLILFFVFILGTIRADNSLNIDKTLKDISSNNAVLSGQIISSKDISYKNNKVKFYLNVKEADFEDNSKDNRDFKDINSKVLVSSNLNDHIEKNIEIGDYIEVRGKFTPPKPSTNPYQFNYEKYLAENDCFSILYADPKSFKIIKLPEFSIKNPNDSWFFVLKKFEKTRNKILEKHSENIQSPKLEILGGIVFGDETINPDEKIKENFKNSGLLHLLAASGLNVALIYGIWWWIAGVIRLPYNISILSGAIFVILYTFMTGFPPSILRAGIMLLFVLFGKVIDRNVSSVALIFFAGFIMLLCNPKMFFDIGFQLSFMVTLGLIICCPVILSKFKEADENYKEKFKNKNKILRYFLYFFTPSNIVSAFTVPLIAQLWVIPLQMHYFNNLAPLSVFANMAVIPFIGILSFIGFMGSILTLIPFLNNGLVFIFDFIANPMLELLIKISEFFASFKISLITTVGMNIFQIFCFWLILLIAALNIQNNFKKRNENIFLLTLIIIFILSFSKIGYFSKSTQIAMFDVSSDNCILIKTPQNDFILYDIPTLNIGFNKIETIINKYLQNERIRKIKYIIIPDDTENKTKNLKFLAPNIKYDNLITLKSTQNDNFALKEKDFSSDVYLFEKSSYTLINHKNGNILIINEFNKSDFIKIEKQLPDKINILKLSEKISINFIDEYTLNRLKPDYVLISDGNGKNNKINPKIINLFYDKNVKILRTKDYGFIKISLKEKTPIFYNFNKNKLKLEKIKFYNKTDFSKSGYIKEFIKKNQ